MSGATTELNLATAVDADDNADYLTLSLANSLRTVDALFNNVSGHTHSGAHQGGAIGTIPASAIPPNSITSAMIVDGAITSADIADGTIQAVDLAVGATAFQFNPGYSAAPSFSTTTTGTWLATPVSVVCSPMSTGAVGYLFLGYVTFRHSVANGNFYVGLSWDGTSNIQTVMTRSDPISNGLVGVTIAQSVNAPGGSPHTLFVVAQSLTAGTLDMPGSAYLNVIELRR
jgi:hypothetical protein